MSQDAVITSTSEKYMFYSVHVCVFGGCKLWMWFSLHVYVLVFKIILS